MAVMMGNLYSALTAAGASEEKAQAAAEEVASYDNAIADLRSDMRLVKWMLGALLALNVAMFVNQLFH
jgi:hypothetical protein